jgi:ATP-dependent RNA helicase DHX57
MYDADPFAARKAVDERQEKAEKNREKSSMSTGSSIAATSPEFAHSPEVKMALSVRETVESSIKLVGLFLIKLRFQLNLHQAFELYPEAAEVIPIVLDIDQLPDLQRKLQTLGFKSPQARTATEALSKPSILTSTLLSSLGALDACLEYLLLHVPECDLPERFLPVNNTSASFISSTHSGTEDLKMRWLQDKAVKECGWPAHAVKDVLSSTDSPWDWYLLVKALNCKLMGDDYAAPENEFGLEIVGEEELDALGATVTDDHILKLPLPVAPLHLYILFGSSPHCLPPHGDPPAMYLTSGDIPAYIRLHMLTRLIGAFRNATLVEPGESVIMAVIRFLEEEWAYVQDYGPPDISIVLKHLLPRKPLASAVPKVGDLDVEAPTIRGFRPTRRDGRSDSQVKEDFELMKKKPGYHKILSARQRLPAFATKEIFLQALEKNRCVVVVGETGETIIFIFSRLSSDINLLSRLRKNHATYE